MRTFLVCVAVLLVTLPLSYIEHQEHINYAMGKSKIALYENVEQLIDSTTAISEIAAHRAMDENYRNWITKERPAYFASLSHHIRHIIVFDGSGTQVAASFSPFTPITVADREYFKEMNKDRDVYPPSILYGPYIGRNTGRWSYAVASRINTFDGDFDGILLTVLAVEHMDIMCNAALTSPGTSAAILSPAKKVIISCGPEKLEVDSVAAEDLELMKSGKLYVAVWNNGEIGEWLRTDVMIILLCISLLGLYHVYLEFRTRR